MPSTTPRGYEYPEYTDAQNFPVAIQTLAEDIDADVQTVADAIADSLDRPSCTLESTVSQSVPSGALTALTWATELYDNDGMGNVPTGINLIDDGIYLITARVAALVNGAAPASFSIEARITSSGGFIAIPVQVTLDGTNAAGEESVLSLAALHFTDGAPVDAIGLSVLHDAGVNINFGPRDMTATKVSNILSGL